MNLEQDKGISDSARLEQSFLFDTGASPIIRKRQNNLSYEKRELLFKSVEDAILNPEQRKAVDHLFGPQVIRAGAGSGKTGSIAYRVANLVAKGATPGRILCVTFTKEAAKEMKARCKRLLYGPDPENPITKGFPKVRTLHALGLKVIVDHAYVLGFKHCVTVLPEMYKDQYLEDAIDLIPKDIKAKIKVGRKDDPFRPQIEFLATEISNLKNVGISPTEAQNKKHPIAEAYVCYQKNLQRECFVDFDDLIRLPAVIFEKENKALIREQERYDFMIIDEFQDMNPAQEAMISYLTKKHRNLSVVGDDDQSIYGWRGSDVRLIIDFPKKFPDCHEVTFYNNYRSTPQIVQVANTLIAHSDLSGRTQKVMQSVKSNGLIPTVTKFNTDTDEAMWIAKGIHSEVGDKSREYGDYAILVRDRFKAERIEEELASLKIPYQTWFSDRFPFGPTKRNAFAILDALHDFDNNPAISQLLRSPKFEVEKNDRDKLISVWENSDASLYSFIKSDNLPTISEKSHKTLKELVEALEELYRQAIPGKRRKGWMATVSKKAFSLLNPLATEESLWDDPNCINKDTRLLRKLWQRIEQYENSPNTKPASRTFAGYLQFEDEIRRRAKEGKNKSKAGEKRSAVWIMSFHAAKGLEFPVVYMPYLVEGALPDKRAVENEKKKPAELEEELRLAFVGVTRAEEELRLSYPLRRVSSRKRESFTESRYIQMMDVRHEGELF